MLVYVISEISAISWKLKLNIFYLYIILSIYKLMESGIILRPTFDTIDFKKLFRNAIINA